MRTFFISCTSQIQYYRYHSIPSCDQMIAVLTHSGFPWSRCFQIEKTGSKLEENLGISQRTELSIINWAILMCTFLFLLTRLVTERKQEEFCWKFFLRPIKNNRLRRWMNAIPICPSAFSHVSPSVYSTPSIIKTSNIRTGITKIIFSRLMLWYAPCTMKISWKPLTRVWDSFVFKRNRLVLTQQL